MKPHSEEAFEKYKTAECKAMDILAQMKATGATHVDIELALLVAVYELHKGKVPTSTIARIIQGHMETLNEYYGGLDPASN